MLRPASWADTIATATGCPVKSIEERPLSSLWAGYGRVSSVTAHMALQPSPLQLIVKQVTPPLASGVGHARKLKSYEVEAHFYHQLSEDLAQATGLHLPRAIHVASDPPKAFTFILTDLGPAFPIQLDQLDVESLKVALEWLACLHAFYWERVPSRGLWDVGSYWHLDTRQEEWRRIGAPWSQLKQVAAEYDLLLKGKQPDGSYSVQHRTLIHGDAKQENILFSQDLSRCAFYDFQYTGPSFGVRDVVYLFCSSAHEADLLTHEDMLLRHYFDALKRHLAKRHDSETTGPGSSSTSSTSTSSRCSGGAGGGGSRQGTQAAAGMPGRGPATALHGDASCTTGGGEQVAAEEPSYIQEPPGASYSFEVMQQHYEWCLVDYARFMAGWGWWGAVGWAQRRCREILSHRPS